MRLAVVANPRAGTAPDPNELERLLTAGGSKPSLTAIDQLSAENGRLDDDRLAAAVQTLSKGGRPDRIVVAGGDGSIGPCARFAQELGVALAVVPVGTANDFARARSIPLDLEQACALACDPAAATRPADLAEAGGRPFVNAAAAGLAVIAAREARPHKARLGPLAYAVGALKAGLTATPVRCRVVCDGHERYSGKIWQVIVGVTGAFGGGSEIGGTDEGRLDVAIVPTGSRAGLVRRAYAMRAGKLTAQDDISHLYGGVVDGERCFNVDGELCRCVPARFVLRPQGFEVVVA